MYKYIFDLTIRVDKIQNLENIILKKLNLKKDNLLDYTFFKKSIDARNKEEVKYQLSLLIKLKYKNSNKLLKEYIEKEGLIYKKIESNFRPIVIGFGPSGMFSALILARFNLKPIIIERGSNVDERKLKIEDFFKNKILDEDSNVVYGEGGAGTFSDGKLQSNIKNEYNKIVLEELVKHGANEDILYNNYPHVGTDILEKVCKNIRKEIINLGGDIYFNHTFVDIIPNKNETIIKVLDKNKNIKIFKSNAIILGIGHSAFDTIEMLYKKGLNIAAKPFSMGVRIEHLQDEINKSQYGKYHKYLDAAPYKLAVHLKERSIYTFCMCPGGYVVASQDKKNTIVTNGMSYSKRDGKNANSALLVEVKVKDYYKDSPLDGFYFQHKYESLAFNMASNYSAPANLMKEFLEDKIASNYRSVIPTYPHGVYFCNLKECLPDFVYNSLKEALPLFNKKLNNFIHEDSVITAIESRSSSPITMKRDNYLSNISNLYVVGEGSGHAGGIMTSAIDGIKCALIICDKLKNI